MLFICYKKCSTCQKAQKWLEEKNLNFEIRDIKEKNPSVEELTLWIANSGKPVKKFFNTSGLKYKELRLKDRLDMICDEEKIELLASDGMLVKRPILIEGEKVLVGFKEDEWESLLADRKSEA